jgi:signal transduction histidine kinase
MASLGLVWAIGVTVLQWARHTMTPQDAAISAALLPITAATAGWALTRVRRSRPARVPLAVHTLSCFLQVIVFGPLWQAASGQILPPPAFTIELAAAASWTCLIWPLSVADLVVTVTLGSIVLNRTGTTTGVPAWGNSVYHVAIGLIATMAWTAIVAAVRLSQRVHEASARSVDDLVRAKASAAESNRWDGIIHDHVLNALGSASRSAPPGSDEPVRILARDALDALHRSDARAAPAVTIAGRLADSARALGLDAGIDIEGEPPPAIAAPIERAADQALANVAQHSGTSEVSITGTFGAEAAELVVRDHGAGFDPAQVSERRRGLRGSIVGAMEVRGGRARIDSAPGRGTTVTLSWRAPAIDAVQLSQLGAFRAMVGFFILTLVISLMLGWAHWDAVVHLPAQIAGSLVLVLATAAAMAWRPLTRGVQIGLAATTICCQMLMLGNLSPSGMPIWQEWPIGFGIGIFAPLAWRTRSRWWAVVAAAGWPVITVGGALLDGADPLMMMATRASSFTWPLILSFAAAWAATSVNRSLATISRSQARILDAANRRARADAVRREADRRLATIRGRPMEMLEYLAGGGEITGEVRRQCRLLEASTRDLLVAPFILDERMRRHFRAARERGARITVTGADPVSDEDLDAAEAFRQVCVVLSDAATAGHRLTCRWHPGDEREAATVALVSLNDPPGIETPEGASPGGAPTPLSGVLSGLAVPVDVIDAGGGDVLIAIG